MNDFRTKNITCLHLLFWLSGHINSTGSSTSQGSKNISLLNELVHLLEQNIIHETDKARALTIVSELQGTTDVMSAKIDGRFSSREATKKHPIVLPHPLLQSPSKYLAWEAGTHPLFIGEPS